MATRLVCTEVFNRNRTGIETSTSRCSKLYFIHMASAAQGEQLSRLEENKTKGNAHFEKVHVSGADVGLFWEGLRCE